MQSFFYITLPFIIVTSLYIFLGLLVYFKNKSSRLNQIFLAFSMSLMIWMFFNYLADADVGHALLWSRLTYAGSSSIVIFLLYFALYFPKNSSTTKIWVNILVIGIPTIFIILSIFTDLIVKDTQIMSWGTDIVPGSLNSIYPLFFLTAMITSFVILRKKYLKASGIEKSQLLFVMIGLILGLVTGFYTNSISYFIIGDYRLAKYGPYTSVFILIFIAYSILAHHLFDIRIIIKKTLVYSTLLLFVLVVYSLVVMSATVLVGGSVSVFGAEGVFTARMMLPNIFAALLIAIGFDPLKNWLSHTTDKWLFKGEYDEQKVLSELSGKLSSAIDLDDSVGSMMRQITEAMRISNAATMVLKRDVKIQDMDNKERPGETQVKRAKTIGYDNERAVCESVKPLVKYFEKHKNEKIILTDDLERSSKDNTDMALVEMLRKNKAALAIPIRIRYTDEDIKKDENIKKGDEKLIGVFILGEKLSGDMFSDKDLNLLDIAVKQTAAGIEKARFFEEDQLKSEFVSIASHELLTPTSAIEGYLSMILDEKLAKVDKKGQEYLRKVQASSQRLATLIKELLNVSRIEGGRVIIQWQAFDINELIQTVIDELMPKAKEKKLQLKFQIPNSQFLISNKMTNDKSKNDGSSKIGNSKLEIGNSRQGRVIVFADQDRVHQALVNIIGNAIKYTEEGSITISHTIKNNTEKSTIIELGNNTKDAEITVSDTGIGMCKEDAKNLFQKFYRASNAGKYGASGTGLGLYITKSLIEMMGGQVTVDSELNKGTKFHFTLKMATDDQVKSKSEKPQGPAFMSSQKQ